MRKATYLTLIGVGAMLAFAVHGHPSFLNIQVIGWIIMATGAAGILMPESRYAGLRRRVTRKRFGPAGGVTETDERALNSGSLPAEAADTAELAGSHAENEPVRVESVDDYYYGR